MVDLHAYQHAYTRKTDGIQTIPVAKSEPWVRYQLHHCVGGNAFFFFVCLCVCVCRCCCLCQSIYIVLTSNNVCMCTFAHGVWCARCDRTGTERTWKPWIDQQYHHGRSFAHSPTVSDNIRVNTTAIMLCIRLCIYCRLLASTVYTCSCIHMIQVARRHNTACGDPFETERRKIKSTTNTL